MVNMTSNGSNNPFTEEVAFDPIPSEQQDDKVIPEEDVSPASRKDSSANGTSPFKGGGDEYYGGGVPPPEQEKFANGPPPPRAGSASRPDVPSWWQANQAPLPAEVKSSSEGAGVPGGAVSDGAAGASVGDAGSAEGLPQLNLDAPSLEQEDEQPADGMTTPKGAGGGISPFGKSPGGQSRSAASVVSPAASGAGSVGGMPLVVPQGVISVGEVISMGKYDATIEIQPGQNAVLKDTELLKAGIRPEMILAFQTADDGTTVDTESGHVWLLSTPVDDLDGPPELPPVFGRITKISESGHAFLEPADKSVLEGSSKPHLIISNDMAKKTNSVGGLCPGDLVSVDIDTETGDPIVKLPMWKALSSTNVLRIAGGTIDVAAGRIQKKSGGARGAGGIAGSNAGSSGSGQGRHFTPSPTNFRGGGASSSFVGTPKGTQQQDHGAFPEAGGAPGQPGKGEIIKTTTGTIRIHDPKRVTNAPLGAPIGGMHGGGLPPGGPPPGGKGQFGGQGTFTPFQHNFAKGPQFGGAKWGAGGHDNTAHGISNNFHVGHLDSYRGAFDAKGSMKGGFSGKGDNITAQMYIGYVHEINPDRHHGFLRSRTIMSIWPGKDAYIYGRDLYRLNVDRGDVVAFQLVEAKDGKPTASSRDAMYVLAHYRNELQLLRFGDFEGTIIGRDGTDELWVSNADALAAYGSDAILPDWLLQESGLAVGDTVSYRIHMTDAGPTVCNPVWFKVEPHDDLSSTGRRFRSSPEQPFLPERAERKAAPLKGKGFSAGWLQEATSVGSGECGEDGK